MRKTKRQLREAECSIRDLPVELQDAIATNEDIDCLVLADTLAKLNAIMDYLSDDENYYASSVMASDDFPGKAIYTDDWNRKWIPQA